MLALKAGLLLLALAAWVSGGSVEAAGKGGEEGEMSGQRELTVFLGDSLTAGQDWNRALPGRETANLGISGDTCAGVWSRLDEAAALKPTRIFLQIGINDFLRGASSKEILKGHRRIWDELAALRPETRLYVVALLPYVEAALPGLPPNLEIVRLNQALAAEADRRGLVFIDLFRALSDEDHQLRLEYTSDGLHLTPQAYQVWTEALRPHLSEDGAKE